MKPKACRPVRVSAVLEADPEELFAFVSDTQNDPLWCPNVDSAKRISGTIVAPGAKYRYEQHLDRGKERLHFSGETEVVDWRPGHIVWHVTDKYQTRTITLTVRPHKKGARIEQVTHATFHQDSLIIRWLYPILARKTLKGQLQTLSERWQDIRPGRSRRDAR